ncbi:MAG: hypothetical protein HRU72_11445 [Planctomycetia bacterium]|nr:hypothetical protein [Candidatus Brocadia sp.]QOJ07108.1 MAG: hypothetical protein HRU72_11445 [Planctomycetia bacterium]TVL97856.1 MAG: hypothetical protein CV082_02580 [Candidatus Brocadia sp. BL1]HQU31424.1 hypothetical protein [Candidatus Brocadia sapporoensis]
MKMLYAIFKSQKLGILIGFSVTGLLIIGSLIMNFNPRQYAGLSGEDISFFFIHKHPIHLWFYLLFLACVLYGINTFLCTLDSIIRKTRSGVKKVTLYGASVVHIGFVITLIAHLVGGLYSTTEPPITVAEEWTDLGGVKMKVTNLTTSSYPNGMPKKITASVAIRKDGIEFSDTLGYNNPVLLQHGISEILMQDYGWLASGMVLKVDDRSCNLKVNETFNVNGRQVRVADLYMPPQYRYPVVKLVSAAEDKPIFLPIGMKNGQELYGAKIVFEDVNSVPGVSVSVKNNPSIPLTFVTIFFFSAGMLLVILRMVFRTVTN